MNSMARGRWWLALLIFGSAMGALEGIVVIYLRALYYPDGFSFPLAPMPQSIYVAELVREACTLLMLGGLAALATTGFLRQFAVFLWSFIIWDVAYYVALKVALDWPESWLTWDILFLIPMPWVGPVLAPLLYCTAMAAVGWGGWRLAGTGSSFRRGEVVLIAVSVALALWAFMEEPMRLLVATVAGEPDRSRHPDLVAAAFQAYVPAYFNWTVFSAALASGYLASWRAVRRAAPGPGQV